MKHIQELKKLKRHVMIVVDDQEIIVEPEMVIKYRLQSSKTIDDDLYLAFLQENQYLSCLRLSLTKLKKMMTIDEMKIFLSEQTYPLGIQKQVIHYLIDHRYLNDGQYAKAYLELKKYQEGPSMITFKLKQKGVSETIIEGLWHTYDEQEVIQSIVKSKLRSIKNKTTKQITQTLKMQLFSKGFQREVIDAVLYNQMMDFGVDESKLIEQTYSKLYQTYSKKLTGQELQYKLKEKLYQKGFSYDMIKSYIDKNNL